MQAIIELEDSACATCKQRLTTAETDAGKIHCPLCEALGMGMGIDMGIGMGFGMDSLSVGGPNSNSAILEPDSAFTTSFGSSFSSRAADPDVDLDNTPIFALNSHVFSWDTQSSSNLNQDLNYNLYENHTNNVNANHSNQTPNFNYMAHNPDSGRIKTLDWASNSNNTQTNIINSSNTPALSPFLSNALTALVLRSHPPSPFVNYAVSPAISPSATPMMVNPNLHPSSTPLMIQQMSMSAAGDAEFTSYLLHQQNLQHQQQKQHQHQMNLIADAELAESLAAFDAQIFAEPLENFTPEQLNIQSPGFSHGSVAASLVASVPETLEMSLSLAAASDAMLFDACASGIFSESILRRLPSSSSLRSNSFASHLTVPGATNARVSPYPGASSRPTSPFHGYGRSRPNSRSSTPLPPYSATSSPVPSFPTGAITAAPPYSLQTAPTTPLPSAFFANGATTGSFATREQSSSSSNSASSTSSSPSAAKLLAKSNGTAATSHPFQCPIESCSRSYKSKSSLDHHVTTFHEGQRRFVCTEEGCGKRYQTKNRLKVHMRSHTGELPYNCNFDGCTFAAAQKCALTHHQRRKKHFGESDGGGAVSADDGEEEISFDLEEET